MKLFIEEQKVLDLLLAEWYEEVKGFQEDANGVFSEKGKMYDRSSPVWERINFPHGFVQELKKKIDRLSQLLDGYDPNDFFSVQWSEVEEETGDVHIYSAMFGGLIRMLLAREAEKKGIQVEADPIVKAQAGRGVSPRKRRGSRD